MDIRPVSRLVMNRRHGRSTAIKRSGCKFWQQKGIRETHPPSSMSWPGMQRVDRGQGGWCGGCWVRREMGEQASGSVSGVRSESAKTRSSPLADPIGGAEWGQSEQRTKYLPTPPPAALFSNTARNCEAAGCSICIHPSSPHART